MRDELFEEVAKWVIINKAPSLSAIQRNFRLGFNRGSRIVDELEEAGIIGPFNGSKLRHLIVTDINELELILRNL